MLRFAAVAVSDTGRHRTSNQDSAFSAASGVGVADGVGGGPSGDVASAVLVHRLAAGGLRFEGPDELRMRLRLANWDIGALTRHDDALEGMATTFTGAFLQGDSLMLAHVGDSRAYLLREGELMRRTRDDSFVQHLVDAGMVSVDAAATHPRRNLITASFSGAEDDAGDLTVTVEPAWAGDRWLFCSDGVSDYLGDAAIAELLGRRAPSDAAHALVSAALDSDSTDNVTAVVADVTGDPFTGVRRRGAREPVEFAGAAGAMFCEEPA